MVTLAKPTVDLYPHNRQAYESILQMWETSNKAAVIHATGTGKSFLILQCLFDHLEQNTMVLAPTYNILMQLSDKAEGKLLNTTLMTYAKLSGLSPSDIQPFKPSMIVLDEFHRCGAKEWGRGVQALLTAYPNAKVLGTSATPIRYLDGERDMSDELFDKNIASTISLTDAVAKAILPKPIIVTALYTFEEEVKKMQGKIDNSSNDAESKAMLTKELEQAKRQLDKSKGIPEILKKHSAGAGKYIVFCKDKAHLHEIKPLVVEWFKKATERKVETYSIFHDSAYNDEQHKSFRDNANTDNVRLMFSIEMYNEGIHIDDVTGVVLLRPTTSPIIYYQQIGRAIQSGNTNEPLIFDFVNNKDSIRVGDIEGDMKVSVEREKKRRSDAGEPEIEIPSFTIYDETVDALELFASLEGELVDSFDANFDALVAYIDKHEEYPRKGTRLNNWVRSIREASKGRSGYLLTLDRIDKLNSIGFAWNPDEERWYSEYEKLKTYLEEHEYEHPTQGNSLYTWIFKQKEIYKKRKLSIDRAKKLATLGIDLRMTFEVRWNDAYQHLVEFRKANGNLLVPEGYTVGGINLSNWIATQRSEFKKGNITETRVNKLKSLGLDFSPTDSWSESWECGYRKLIDFKKTYGHCRVLRRNKHGGFNLGSWVGIQRQKYKTSKLTQDRIDRLNAIGFMWEAKRYNRKRG